jgi:hypothetical protein
VKKIDNFEFEKIDEEVKNLIKFYDEELKSVK